VADEERDELINDIEEITATRQLRSWNLRCTKRRQDLGWGQTASTDHDFWNYGWSWHERRNCSRSSTNNGVLPQFPITSALSGDRT